MNYILWETIRYPILLGGLLKIRFFEADKILKPQSRRGVMRISKLTSLSSPPVFGSVEI